MKKFILIFILITSSWVSAQDYVAYSRYFDPDYKTLNDENGINEQFANFSYAQIVTTGATSYRKTNIATASVPISYSYTLIGSHPNYTGSVDCRSNPSSSTISAPTLFRFSNRDLDVSNEFGSRGVCFIDYTLFYVKKLDPAPIETCVDDPLFTGTGTTIPRGAYWEYSRNGITYSKLKQPNSTRDYNQYPITSSVSKLLGADYTGALYVRFVYGTVESETIRHNVIGCSPNIIESETSTTAATCFGENDGSISLTFDDTVEDNYSMWYYIYEGEAPSTPPTQEELEDTNPPQAASQPVIGKEDIILTNGNYVGTTPSNIGPGDYYIIFQERSNDVVKSAGYTSQTITIQEPTEVEIDIDNSTFVQGFCGENSTITLAGKGGNNLTTGLPYTFEYKIGNGGWQDVSGNSITIAPNANAQVYTVKAIYNGCESPEVIYNIDATPETLSFNSTSPGIASSSIATDGQISAVYEGGTAGATGYTFILTKTSGTIPATVTEVINTTNQTITYSGLDVGLYQIEITDGNNCKASSGDIAVTAAPLPTFGSPTYTEITCSGNNDGEFSIPVSYGNANNISTTISYRLLDSGDNQIRLGSIEIDEDPNTNHEIAITGLASGNYTLAIVASTGDFGDTDTIVTRTITIDPVNPIAIDFSASIITNASCNGLSDGSVQLSVSGSSEYQYALSNFPAASDWVDLPIDNTIRNLAGRTYSIILRNKNNTICQSIVYSNAFEIIEPSEFSIEENIADVSTNNGFDGAISINNISGGALGNPAYTFTWTATLINGNSFIPETTQNIQNLFAGDYFVEVAVSNECKQTFGPFRVNQPGPLSVDGMTGTDTCNGIDTGTITATVQGTGDITFEFIRNPGPSETVLPAFTTADRTVTFDNLVAGTYSLRITEVDSGNEYTTPIEDYVIITELEQITATITPTDATCALPNSGTITISGVMGGSPFTTGPNALTGYEYRINDSFNNFQPEANFNGLTARDYIVTVRDALGCEYTETVTIEAGELPVLNQLTTVVTNASSDTNLDGSIILEFETDPTNYTYQWTGPNVTNPNARNQDSLGEGTYQVIITAPGNCTLPRIFTVGVADAFSIQDFTGTASCFGQSSGSLTATIAATGSVVYNWRFQDGTLAATETSNLRTLSTNGLAAGFYYLEIVGEANQTAQSAPFEILNLPEVFAVVTPTPTCIGEDTGTITFSGQTGSSSDNYSYSIDNWVTTQTEPLFETLQAGTYTPRMRSDENPECEFIAPGVTIGTSTGLFFDLDNSTITRASGPNAQDGAITAAFIGGTGPYTFEWTPNPTNSTGATNTGLGAGTYNLTITDAANCSISEDFEVTEVGPLTISNVNPTDATCRGEASGSITTTVTGEGTITFNWTLANGDPVPVSNGVNEQNLTGILAGSYILTATDDNATQSTAAITIGEPATTLTITNINPTDVTCFGGNSGSLEIQAAGGTGPYTYSLNGGNFQTSPIFNNLLANSYTVRVQDANGCEFLEPTPILIIEPEELNLIINEQRPVTAANATNGAIFITVEGGSGDYTYEWTGPNGYASNEEDPLNLAAGDYNVTITDVNFALTNGAGCRLVPTQPITITEPGELLANATQTVLLSCFGDDFAEITANVQGGVAPYTYQWFQVVNGNNTLLDEDTDIIGNLTVGTYFVRVTDANTIQDDSNQIVINAPTLLQVAIDNTTNVLCAGQPTGAINITVSGGTPPYQYFWSNSATVPNINGLDAGLYIIDVEDAEGCLAQATATITAPDDAIQIANATVNDVSAYQALDGSISLAISGGSTPYTYLWTRLSNNSNAGNQATISNLAADSYSVAISDTNGCTVTETYEVTQPDIIEETILQPSCLGDSDGSISVSVNQGNGTFTYLWNTGSTENNINNLAAGSYTVTITGLADGPVTRTYVLENPVPLEVNLGTDRVLCADQTLELDATVDDETATYSWTSENGFSSSNPIVVLSATGNYTVTVQSATGCTTQGTIFVDVSTGEIDAEFAMSSQVFVGETAVAVDISYPLPEGIEWIVPIGANVITQNQDEAEFSFAEAGEYDITIITSRGGCIAQKTKKILVVATDGLIQEDNDKTGQKLVEEFLVYPNPTTGRFTADVNLTEPGDISIKVFNFANNAMMASERGRGETSYNIPFDISGMPSGVYAVLLETPYGTSLRKIVVR